MRPDGTIASRHYPHLVLGTRRPKPAVPLRGTWEAFRDIDMSEQGDVQLIEDWKSTHSVEDLKRIVEAEGWSAFTVSAGQPAFGHGRTPAHGDVDAVVPEAHVAAVLGAEARRERARRVVSMRPRACDFVHAVRRRCRARAPLRVRPHLGGAAVAIVVVVPRLGLSQRVG